MCWAFAIGTAFANVNGNSSQVFQNLLANRQIVSQVVGADNPNSNILPSGFYSGYSGSQQEVVDPAEEEVVQAAFNGLGPSDESLHEGHLPRLQQAQRAHRVLHVVRPLQAEAQRSRNL